MLELQGKHNKAIVYTDNIESEAISQIIELCNQEAFKDSKIRIMPDVHAGAGCVIGFSADLGDKVIPNIVGVDIGCGMLTVPIGRNMPDLCEMDAIINQYVPSGFNVHEGRISKFDRLQDIKCYRELKDTRRIQRGIGTLGGGNHFIELSKSTDGLLFLIIHTGSRNLGKQVADYYQNLAIELHSGRKEYYDARDQLISSYKQLGKQNQIGAALNSLDKQYKQQKPDMPKDLCYLSGKYRDDYLNDMKICQEYANLNREVIAEIILNNLFGTKLMQYKFFHTVHNYIDFNDNIVRKGAIKADRDRDVLIPINMRDGSIIGLGLGNNDWNQTAPHGAGRLMSRRKAKDTILMDDFTNCMEGIYSSSVLESTLDEAPMAYKSINDILENIKETVDVIDILKPIYNYKAH